MKCRRVWDIVGYGIGEVSEGVVCGGTLWDMTWVKCQRVRCVEEGERVGIRV